ncbi:MAG: transglutaminase-like domain-containing protein [Phycisphaerales bacterium]|nr:transglutaminase-like domain-containing protein [Phycisphaerales bacterium]
MRSDSPRAIVRLVLAAGLAVVPVFSGCSSTAKSSSAAPAATSAALKNALDRAGGNRPQIEAALRQIPDDQAFAMRWLVERMPTGDLQTLDAAFLLRNCDLAYRAWNDSPWRQDVPEDVFLDAILPYASVNEKREDWRTGLRERCLSLIAQARSASHAAAIINRELFALVNVKYSTKRPKPDQSPSESIAAGMASCTGLSILLIDACRSVGIPARFVGTALWSDRSGNHSWVEIWDKGWQFTGAAEPTGDELNRGWFTDRAATARRDDPMMAIYAVTWRETSLAFPMVWLPGDQSVRAVDVTDRYTSIGQVVPEGQARVRVRVAGPTGRVSVPVTIRTEDGVTLFTGTSKDERFDANDHLSAVLVVGTRCTVEVPGRPGQAFTVERDEQLVEIVLPAS